MLPWVGNLVRRLRQDLASVLFHCLKMLPMVRAQDKAHLWYDLVQQHLLWGNGKAWEWWHRGCGGSGLTHLRVEELQVQIQLHSIPWHLPFAQPTSSGSSNGAVPAHTPRTLTGLFVPWGSTKNSLGSCQPRVQWDKSGTNSPKSSPESGQRGDTRSCPYKVLPFLLTAAMLHTCTTYSLAASSKAFLTSRQFIVWVPQKVCLDGGLENKDQQLLTLYTSSWPGRSCGSAGWLSWKRDHSISRDTVAPLSPFIPSPLPVTLIRNRATRKQLPVWLQAMQTPAAAALLSTQQPPLSSQAILFHITSAHKRLSLFPTHLPSSDFVSPSSSCHNLVPPWDISSSAACKVVWLPAGNPCTPQEQHLACRVLVPPQ